MSGSQCYGRIVLARERVDPQESHLQMMKAVPAGRRVLGAVRARWVVTVDDGDGFWPQMIKMLSKVVSSVKIR